MPTCIKCNKYKTKEHFSTTQLKGPAYCRKCSECCEQSRFCSGGGAAARTSSPKTNGGGGGEAGFMKQQSNQKDSPLIYIPRQSEQSERNTPIVALLSDCSGSMSMDNRADASRHNTSALFVLKGIELSVIPFGSHGLQGYVGYQHIPIPQILTSAEQFRKYHTTEWATYTHMVNNLRLLQKKPNVLVFHGDGDFSDRGFVDHIRSLACDGWFDEMTHFVITFAYKTEERHKNSLISQLKSVLAQFPRIGKEVEIATFTQFDRTTFVELLNPIIESYQQDFNIPEHIPQKEMRFVSRILAYHKSVTATELAEFLSKSSPLIIAKIFEAIKKVIQLSPELLVAKESVWPKVHKVLHIIFHESGEYRDFFNNHLKEMRKIGSPNVKPLEELIRSSFQDTAEFSKIMKELMPYIIGFMVCPIEQDADEIIDDIRAKHLILWKSLKILPSTHIVPRKVEVDYRKEIPGMPILGPDASPQLCRKAMRLFFAQWTKASLSPHLEWLCAITLLTKIEREIEPPIVEMIKKAILGDEALTIKMLGMTKDGIDAQQRPLLFSVRITSMLVEVLTKYPKEMFPISLGHQEGESSIPREQIIHQIITWKKVGRIQKTIKEIQQFQYVIKDYPIEVLIDKKGSSIATSKTLMVGQIVEYTKSWPGEPWKNIPTIGIVLKLDDYGSYIRFIIQQLDDIEWDREIQLKYDFVTSNGDTRQHVCGPKKIQDMGLRILHSPITDHEGFIIQEALPEYYERVTVINKYLMDLKAGGGIYGKTYPLIPQKRRAVLKEVERLLGTKKALTQTVPISISIPLERLYHILPLPEYNLWQLIKAKANPSMSQILEIVSAEIHSSKDIRSHCSFKHSFDDVSYDITITPKILADIHQKFDDTLQEKYGEGIQCLHSIDCIVCFDQFPYTIDGFSEKVFKNTCGHYICIECKDALQKTYLPHGETTQVLDMDNCCPQCRDPFPHSDERINTLYKTHQRGLTSDSVFMICSSDKCGHKIFLQPSPECGGGAEALHTLCESCRIPPREDTKPCPSCDTMIQWTTGCDHMTCHCGTHFCFVCLEIHGPDNIYDHMFDKHGGINTTQSAMNSP